MSFSSKLHCQETMNKSVSRLITVLVVAALGLGAYYWWQSRQTPAFVTTELEVPTVVVAEPAPLAVPTPVPEPAASAPVAPVVQFPIKAPAVVLETGNEALPALADAQPYISSALTDLLGRRNVLTFLQLDIFARRLVATVDNLSRSHAPLTMWPINPTPGRFTTLMEGDSLDAASVISPDNGLRYTPLVLFIESVNTPTAVALYTRLYPLFQQAYEELGYPGRYFNDRFVAVLDHLMAVPVQSGPIHVSLVEVKGPYPSLRPWVRYEFSNPALEALSSGQKMLVRTGPVNHRRLNSKLLELRTLLAGAALTPSTNTAPVTPPQTQPVIRY